MYLVGGDETFAKLDRTPGQGNEREPVAGTNITEGNVAWQFTWENI